MSTSTEPARSRITEDEPLLGAPGDVAQRQRSSILTNLLTGTAPLAQAGGIALVALTWSAVLTHKLILFSLHPLLNTLGILFAIQALLILQPTHTPSQKRAGAHIHAAFWAGGLGLLYAGLIIIEVHKYRMGFGHFESPHAILGIVIYVLLFLQVFVGITQFYFPGLYGSVDNAKALYRWHRVAGYILVTLILFNVVLASYTYYGANVLGIKTWTTTVASVLVVLGIGPRIKKQKVKLWNRG